MVEGRLRASASTHFNVIGQEQAAAVDQFNIISSKSSAVLPVTTNRQVTISGSKPSKYVSDQAKAVKEAERFRVKNSIQN